MPPTTTAEFVCYLLRVFIREVRDICEMVPTIGPIRAPGSHISFADNKMNLAKTWNASQQPRNCKRQDGPWNLDKNDWAGTAKGFDLYCGCAPGSICFELSHSYSFSERV